MKKITTNLWFDGNAEEAAEFYGQVFAETSVGQVTHYSEVGKEIHGQPAGQIMTMSERLLDHDFLFLNGGPEFKFTPAVSFLVACPTKEQTEKFWRALLPGSKTLMEFGEYPFSPLYGWLEDKFGLSWQIMQAGDMEVRQRITPTLMFAGAMAGNAEEAMNYYADIFEGAPGWGKPSGSKVGGIMRYEAGEAPDKEGTVKHAYFTLGEQEFFAMDSVREHGFTFTEAISFIVNCEDQAEIDYFWEKLTAGGDPASQICGWLKDRYGFSWQIVPTIVGELMSDHDANKRDRVMKVFLGMSKIEIDKLIEAAR